MLVLSRRPGEQIVINDNITITVVAMKGDRIRLGFDAPKGVTIDRAEVHDRRTMIDLELPRGGHAHETGTHPQTAIMPTMELVEAGSF